MSGRPRVVVLSTGGAIASRIDHGRDVVVSTAAESELLAAPEAGDVRDAITSVTG